MNGFDSLLHLIDSAVAALGDRDVQGIGLWFLAMIFAWSGGSKIRRPAVAALALVDFRLSTRAELLRGRLVGVAEVGMSILLSAGAVAGGFLPIVGLAAAAALLVGFTLLIGRALHAGERFPCACFGNPGATLSSGAFARTAALAALTVGLLVGASSGSSHAASREVVLQFVIAAGALGALVESAQAVRLARHTSALLNPSASRP